MPRYVYRCEACKETYETIHGMMEEYEDCDLCNEKGTLTRIPGLIGSFRFVDRHAPVGTLVKKYIKDAKKELQEEKRTLRKKEHK